MASWTDWRTGAEQQSGQAAVYKYVKEKMKFSLQETVPLIFTYNDLNQRFWCFASLPCWDNVVGVNRDSDFTNYCGLSMQTWVRLTLGSQWIRAQVGVCAFAIAAQHHAMCWRWSWKASLGTCRESKTICKKGMWIATGTCRTLEIK